MKEQGVARIGAAIAVPSQTILGGRFAIRVCITNHRSELSDLDALVEAVLALGAEF